jgi:23S rRNA (cytosine1962-C5)-methyltransferase
MENILITEKSKDYELLDSGLGEKLERYGDVVLCRPDPQAIWSKGLSEIEWKKADAVFTRAGTTGKWEVVASSKHLESSKGTWNVSLDGLIFQLELLPSKHLGLFPEQSSQWKWLTEKISNKNQKVRVLNLFGYTGGASLACAKAGAEVCHVDASKFAVDLANTNMKLSRLSGKKIRFIVDDVRKFVEREIKRGNKYEVVIMDPPVYGKGVKGEVWKIEEDLLPLLSRIKNILSEKPLAVVLNGYASGYSSTTYAQMLQETIGLKGEVSHGELAIKESFSGRLLTCGIFARLEIKN